MTDVIAYRGPDDAGFVVRRRLLARRTPALDHRRRGRPPAVRRRARPRLGRAERRDLQPRRRCATELEARGHVLAQPLRHRGPPAPLRGARPRAGRAPARHVRRRRLGPRRAPRRADPRPARHQAALLRDRRRRRRLRLRAQVRHRQRPGQRRARPRGDRRLPDARLRPGPDDAAARRAQARARRAARGRRERRGHGSSAGGRYPAPGRRPHAAHGRGVGRDRARRSSTSPSACA